MLACSWISSQLSTRPRPTPPPKLDSLHDEDFSGSVAWESGPPRDRDRDRPPGPAPPSSTSAPPPAAPAAPSADPYSAYGATAEPTATTTTTTTTPRQGVWDVHVRDGKVELEGTSDTFVSYLVTAHTDLPNYASHAPQIRRRFHDFVFLRRALSHDFTACVVPPLPDKHRMGG